jgi:hypothetical protein
MSPLKSSEKGIIRIVTAPRTFDFPVAQVTCAFCGKEEELVETCDVEICPPEYLDTDSEFSLIDALIEKLEYLGWKKFEVKQVNPEIEEGQPICIQIWTCPACRIY